MPSKCFSMVLVGQPRTSKLVLVTIPFGSVTVSTVAGRPPFQLVGLDYACVAKKLEVLKEAAKVPMALRGD
jgi:hypothetical protein